jgi:hypothetical protein
MMMRRETWLGCGMRLILVASLTGCSKATLEVSPKNFSQCSGMSSSVHVKWTVPDDEPPGAKIYVAGVSHSPRIWKVVGPSGEADTANAIYDGTTFTLRSAKGVLLARRTVTSSPCEK